MAETLNLVNPNDSLSIKYEISKFPDGQQSLRLIESGYITFNSLKGNSNGITIISRLNTFQDLEIIICATQALKEAGVNRIRLYIPYCIGARSDRKFMEGGINYVKTVIAPIINSQGYDKVTIIDPHSDVLEACINNFEGGNNLKLVKFALSQIDNTNEAREKTVIISPDAGALKKIYNVAEAFEISKIVIAAKHRDIKTGNITHTEVPDLNKYRTDSNFVIIDDICDGGRTFIEIAKVIKSHVWPHDEYFKGKIYLIVTHGIFSAGYAQLGEYFDGIYCTNSVKDIGEKDYHALETAPTKVKQLNIF
jgi:ribose-phosphate pyrophosphokinase